MFTGFFTTNLMVWFGAGVRGVVAFGSASHFLLNFLMASITVDFRRDLVTAEL